MTHHCNIHLPSPLRARIERDWHAAVGAIPEEWDDLDQALAELQRHLRRQGTIGSEPQ